MRRILSIILVVALCTNFAYNILAVSSNTDIQFKVETEFYPEKQLTDHDSSTPVFINNDITSINEADKLQESDSGDLQFENLQKKDGTNPMMGESLNTLYCRKITINHSYIDEALSNFPTLVYMSRHANLSFNAQDDGDDISFWSLDNNTQYNHEIEYYESCTGKLAAWVNIPSVSCDIDTEFWMKYGNATCESQERISDVWDSHFGGVWHLNDINASDSTSNNNTGTAIGSPIVSSGKVSDAIDFGSTGNWYGIDLGTDNSIDLSNRDTCTVEFWVYFDVDDEDQMCFVQSQDSHSWNVGLGTFDGDVPNKNMKFIHRDDDGSSRDTVDSRSGVSSSWHYYAGTYNNDPNDNKSIFYDGEWIAGTTSGISNLRDGPATSTTIGYGGDFGSMDGKMDEVRISTNVRNASWIKATYHTVSSNDFLSVQNETDIMPPTVITELPTDITNTTANLRGNLINNGGENCSVWFEYEKYEEGEGECAGLVATGTCVKDGRSIFWKTRHSSSSNNKPDWQSGLNYNYWTVDGYLGMNEAGLAMGNLKCYDLIDEENRDYPHTEIQGDGVNGLSTAIHRALGRYDTVGEAARFMAINCTYNGNYQVGIVSSEPGVGAVVSMMNYSGTIYTHITWVNNTWAHLANVHYCDWVTSGWDANDPNDNNDETIYDMCTDITTNGGINGDHLIDWQEICQRGGKNVSGKEKGTDTFSCNGEIAKGSASCAMVAVSGNSSYDGAANVAFTAFGRQPLVGIFLPLGASYLNSDSDIPSDFRGGGGIEDYVDVKSIYATTTGVVHGNTFYCDRVREVLEYANYNENISFDAYDAFMDNLMTASNTTEAKERLKSFADDNMSLTLTGYINNYIEPEIYENISKMYPHTSGVFNETITGLEPGAAYIVSAWANNSHYLANGSQITFLTKPNTPTDLQVVTCSSTQINLTWTVGTGADRTIIERARSPSWQRGEGTQVYNGIESSYDDTELSAETHYYYQLWSYTETEELYQYSSSFASGDSTTEPTPNNAPYTPNNPNPEDQALDININLFINWTGGDPDPEDIVTYDVYFSTTNPPPQVAWNQPDTTYDPGTLNYEQTYHWKIIAWDNHGEHTEGPVWDFTTEEEPNNPPYVPSNPNPEDGAIDVSINEDISWTGGDPDPGDTVTYDVYYGTTSPSPQVVWGQSGTSYDPGAMNYNTQYFWKIVSWDNHGESTSGPIWDFTTEHRQNNAPSVSNIWPVNELTDVERPPTELNVTIGDSDEDTMNIYIGWKNHDGEWTTLEQYIDVGNGTYNFTSPEGNDWIWGNTIYNWSINATDGVIWTNETYYYTTDGSRYDTNNDGNVNFQDAGLIWTHRTSEADYNGLYDINQDNLVNFQDAGLTWINRD